MLVVRRRPVDPPASRAPGKFLLRRINVRRNPLLHGFLRLGFQYGVAIQTTAEEFSFRQSVRLHHLPNLIHVPVRGNQQKFRRLFVFQSPVPGQNDPILLARRPDQSVSCEVLAIDDIIAQHAQPLHESAEHSIRGKLDAERRFLFSWHFPDSRINFAIPYIHLPHTVSGELASNSLLNRHTFPYSVRTRNRLIQDQEDTMDKIQFPYRSESHLPFLHVIGQSGSWEKHGLDVEYDKYITSEDAHKNVANGSVEFVGGNHLSPYIRRPDGDRWVYLGQSVSLLNHRMVVRPDSGINRVSDLAGKKVASKGQHPGLNTWLFIKQHGLLGDCTIERMRGDTPHWEAVRHGKADAAFVTPPADLQARRRAVKMICGELS